MSLLIHFGFLNLDVVSSNSFWVGKATEGWILFALFKSSISVSRLSTSGMQHSTGQTAWQASSPWKPTHSVHKSGSIIKIKSPSEIALFGHSGSQAPQFMHSSVMTVAIFKSFGGDGGSRTRVQNISNNLSFTGLVGFRHQQAQIKTTVFVLQLWVLRLLPPQDN